MTAPLSLEGMRLAAKLSPRELAERAGISHTTVLNYEHGIVKNPDGHVLEKLALALGVPVADVIRSALAVRDSRVARYATTKARAS